MKKNCMIIVALLIASCCSLQNLQSAPPPPMDQAMLDDLFKDVDFEKIAKDMDQLFKEMEAEEKAKKQSPSVKEPAETFQTPKHEMTFTETTPPTVSPYQAHASAEELFLTPRTETPPSDKKKITLWLTQGTLDATNIILDKLTASVNKLSNKVIEYQVIPLDEHEPSLHDTDIIKVSCNIIKSKTTYKRMLLTPQVLNKELEKPMKQLRGDMLQAIKKADALAQTIKEISPQERQKNDIATLKTLAQKSANREKASETFTGNFAAAITVDSDIEDAIAGDSEIEKAILLPKKAEVSHQKDDILTFFKQTLAPLAKQLGKFTQSPEAKKAIEDQTKERDRMLKEMASRAQSQRSSGRSYGSAGRYPYQSSYASPSYSPAGGASPSHSPSQGSYMPEHDGQREREYDDDSATPLQDNDYPHLYGGPTSSEEKDAKQKELEAKTKLETEQRAQLKAETIRLRNIFTEALTDITTTLDGTGDDWQAYNQEIRDQLAQPVQEIIALYDAFHTSLVKLTKEDQKECLINPNVIIDLLPHLIYAVSYDILDPQQGDTHASTSYKKLLTILSTQPTLKQKNVSRTYKTGCNWITDSANPLHINLDQADKKEPSDRTKIEQVIARLGAKHVPMLTEKLKTLDKAAEEQKAT